MNPTQQLDIVDRLLCRYLESARPVVGLADWRICRHGRDYNFSFGEKVQKVKVCWGPGSILYQRQPLSKGRLTVHHSIYLVMKTEKTSFNA